MKIKLKIIFLFIIIGLIITLTFISAFTFGGDNSIEFPDPIMRNNINHSDIKMSGWALEDGTIINSSINIQEREYDLSVGNIVRSGSMQPAIPIGSTVITRKLLENEDVEIGDIVCVKDFEFKANICHRIIDIDRDMILTKGDANELDDGWRFKKDIVYLITGVLY